MTIISNFQELLNNDDISIFNILYELYMDIQNDTGWAHGAIDNIPASKYYISDKTNIKEPYAIKGKSLENDKIREEAIKNGGNNYNSSHIEAAINSAFPSDLGWPSADGEGVINPPSEEIIIDKYNIIKRELSVDVLKQQEEKILRDTEKYIREDYPHKSKSKKDEWKTYRQSIRTLSKQIEDLEVLARIYYTSNNFP